MPALTDQPTEYLGYQSNQTTFFAEQEYTLIWDKGPGFWRDADRLNFRMVYANTTIFEQNYPPAFPLHVDFKYPQLRPGVTADPVLIVTAFSYGQPLKGIYHKQFFFFSKNQEFTPARNPEDIGVLDRTEDGALKALLNDFEIPFIEITDFSDFNGGWILCAGLDFTGSGSLFDELLQAFSKGISILILPPMEGEFLWPSLTEETRVTLSAEDIVQDADKRFNLLTAGPGGKRADVYFQLESKGDDVVVKCSKTKPGHSWMEFRAKGTKMIFGGWNLQRNAAMNPTMRLLLNNILAHEQIK